MQDFEIFRSIEPQEFVYDLFAEEITEKVEKLASFKNTSELKDHKSSSMSGIQQESQRSSTSGSTSYSSTGSQTSLTQQHQQSGLHENSSKKISAGGTHDSSSGSSNSINKNSSPADNLISLKESLEKEFGIWTKELREFESLSNKEMFWVCNEILNETSLVKRVKVIKYFIKMATICRSLHNYNSLFAILSGLGHGSVQRLKQTWDKLPQKYHKILKSLQSIMDPTRNMQHYRSEINSRHPPIIPFFPIVKKDLTFIHLAHSTRTDDNLINFEKMRMVAKEIRNIMNMSSQQYDPSSPNPLVPPSVYYRRNTTATVGGSIPLPPPPPTTTNGPSATTPKRMYEKALMRKKVKHYLESVFSTINYDEDFLLCKSCEIEPGPTPPQTAQTTPSSVSRSSLGSNQSVGGISKQQPSPTLSSTSSSSSGGKLKFGAESPQQLRKLLSLSEVDSNKSKQKSHSYHHSHHHHHHHLSHPPSTKSFPSNPGHLTGPQHFRSVSEGNNNIMFSTVSYNHHGHPPNYQVPHQQQLQSQQPSQPIPAPRPVPLPVESSSVTSLRRLEQLEQLKRFQEQTQGNIVHSQQPPTAAPPTSTTALLLS